jgi:protein-tyrosine phosphatase
MTQKQIIKVLFVCTENICRSPIAEAVFKHYVKKAGLDDLIFSDSAGTHSNLIGEAPDKRAQRVAQDRGYAMSGLRARPVEITDFAEFDRVLAMDEFNLSTLKHLCPPSDAHKLFLLMQFSDERKPRDIPDPYYGGLRSFEQVLDMIEDATQGLLYDVCEKLLNRNLSPR